MDAWFRSNLDVNAGVNVDAIDVDALVVDAIVVDVALT